MIRPTLVLAVVALLASACAAHKSASPTSGAQAKNGEQADSEQLVCLKEKPTGTHFPKTVCYTQEELGVVSQATQDSIRKASRGGSSPQRSGERSPAASPGAGR
jgi:hypothetical protein